MYQEMSCLKPYEQAVFAGLNEFEIAQKQLETHKKHLEALGTVVCRYGLQDVIGISLLHKQFDISSNEIVVREFVANEAYTKPFPKNDETKAIAYVWKLHWDETTGRYTYYPLEFLYCNERTKEAERMASIIEQSDTFLSEMADTLLQLGVQDIFGISTLNHDATIEVKPEEFLSETTDYEKRTLRIRPELKEESILNRSAETLWRFTLPEGLQANPQIGCDIGCTVRLDCNPGSVTAAMHCTCGPHRPTII